IDENPRKMLSLEASTRWVTNLIEGWSAELKLILERLGMKSIEELRGRRDLLVGVNVSEPSLRVLGIRGEDSYS
ncbi:MAG: hypothetical protein QXP49_06910, partial [Nitrososphaerota archaeon]